MERDYADAYESVSSTRGGLQTVGLDELFSKYDERDLLEQIRSLYEDAASASHQSCPPPMQDVYITGSFAEGRAELLASDLDVRVVVSEPVQRSYVTWVRDFCQENGREYLTNEEVHLFSIVDLWVLNKSPPDSAYKLS